MRYSRQISLPEFGITRQAQLRAAAVLVIGAGGLGCPVLQILGSAGVGHLGIVDGDIVSASNLNRQTLFTAADLGFPKAEVAQRAIEWLNPDCKITSYPVFFQSDNGSQILRTYDIVIDCTDNFAARYLINDICVAEQKPWVFGAIFKFDAQVGVFNYRGSGTYRCAFPIETPENAVANCAEIGVLGVHTHIVGGYMAMEAIKLLTGIGIPLTNQILCINTLNGANTVLRYEPDAVQMQVCTPNYPKQFSDNAIQSITYQTLLQFSPNTFQLIDVRTHAERNIFHIGGIHIPLAELPNAYARLDREVEKLIFYCKSGIRSQKAAQLAQGQGFINIYTLDGGVGEGIKNL
jgi:sulfur-carrier protein adenylyltransferase/sulfurtransferase